MSRRRRSTANRRLRLGDVTIDLAAKTVQRDGDALRLTATQWRLLEVLAQHAGRVVTSRQLLREVWGPGHAEQGHYLRIYIRQLRQKLEADPSRPAFLLTDTGIGYRLLAEAAEIDAGYESGRQTIRGRLAAVIEASRGRLRVRRAGQGSTWRVDARMTKCC